MKRVQFPQDFFCTQLWPPIHFFVHKYGGRDVMWKRSMKSLIINYDDDRNEDFKKTIGLMIISWLAGIPVLWCWIPGGNFPSSHACQAVQRMNQVRNRTAGNTLFMRICFPGSCDQVLNVSCIVTQFASGSFGIYIFRGSYMREYNSI